MNDNEQPQTSHCDHCPDQGAPFRLTETGELVTLCPEHGGRRDSMYVIPWPFPSFLYAKQVIDCATTNGLDVDGGLRREIEQRIDPMGIVRRSISRPPTCPNCGAKGRANCSVCAKRYANESSTQIEKHGGNVTKKRKPKNALRVVDYGPYQMQLVEVGAPPDADGMTRAVFRLPAEEARSMASDGLMYEWAEFAASTADIVPGKAEGT